MKVIIGGETFSLDLDFDHVRMADALEIEKLAGRRYVEWEAEVLGGSAEALCVLACLALRRDGRDVTLADITGGKHELDFTETYTSLADAVRQARAAARAAAEVPTSGAAPRTVPDGTDTTRDATRGSSRKS